MDGPPRAHRRRGSQGVPTGKGGARGGADKGFGSAEYGVVGAWPPLLDGEGPDAPP